MCLPAPRTMIRLFALAATIAVLAITACSRQSSVFEPLDPAPSGAVVGGTVRAQGGGVLANAVVTLESVSGGVTASVRRQLELARAGRMREAMPVAAENAADLRSAVSDAAGRYAFPDVPPGEYVVSATTRDHLAGTRPLQVPASEGSVTVDIFLTPTGSFHGEATLENSNEHQGTVVYVPSTSYVALTGIGGGYTIKDVPIGTWPVRAMHGGYLEAATSGAIGAAGDSIVLAPMFLKLNSNIPPVATAVGPADASETVPAAFSGSATDDDGMVFRYEWDFENDNTFDFLSSGTATTTHIYPSAGTYTAKLRVTDDQGAIGIDAVQVTVKAGVYVSATTGAGGNPGTKAQPLQTISQGLAMAVSSGRTYVFVAGGAYNESPSFVNGKSVVGGFDATWTPTGALTQVNVGTTAATANNVNSSTTIRGLTFVATNSTAGSSIALSANGSTSALLFDLCSFRSGNGSDGAPGVAEGSAGPDGSNGSPGASGACDGPAGLGGLGGAGGGGNTGGAGGNGAVQGSPNNGFAGGVAAFGGGSGGSGGVTFNGGCCTSSGAGGPGGNGTSGSAGFNGNNGSPASTEGTISGGVWFPLNSGSGSTGTSGKGGGGGGGGGGQLGTLINDGGGNGGGGGGGGGGPGTGGSGGSGGFASFAVYLFDASPTFTDCEFQSGNGGTGGGGRNGGAGGAGGNGGTGAAACLTEIGRGGDGGPGAAGGAGGGGAGGPGGPSYCVYRAGASAPSLTGSTYTVGSGGTGGTGGVRPGSGPALSGSTGPSGTVF